MDPLQALLMPVSDDEQMKALARSLRGRQTAADFFSASSIPNLQKMAQNEQQYIQDVGERQGVLREALERRKQDQGQHADMMSFREKQLGQMTEDRAEARALRLSLAQMKGGGFGFNEPSTQKERAAFETGGSEAEKFNELYGSFQPSYSASVPLLGYVENFAGRKFEDAVPEEMRDQASWWSDYKEYAELVRRHGLFGSALTKTESEQWKQATITPNDGPEFIQKKLEAQREFIQKKAEKAAANAMLKGYNPDQIRLNYGGAVDLDSLAERLMSGQDVVAEQPADEPADAAGWTAEDQAELEELERRVNGTQP